MDRVQTQTQAERWTWTSECPSQPSERELQPPSRLHLFICEQMNVTNTQHSQHTGDGHGTIHVFKVVDRTLLVAAERVRVSCAALPSIDRVHE